MDKVERRYYIQESIFSSCLSYNEIPESPKSNSLSLRPELWTVPNKDFNYKDAVELTETINAVLDGEPTRMILMKRALQLL